MWHQGSVYFTEIMGGRISRLTPQGDVAVVAETGGGPNGATLGPDGALWVTQNGGMGSGPRTTAGLQRVTAEGEVTLVVSAVGGLTLDGPNDLAFGADGRLYFTDPRGGADPAHNDKPGRLFVVDVDSGEGELLADVGRVFPNGIAFDADGSLMWTESFSRRVMRLVDGTPELVVQLPERHMPDGMCVGADGKLYVASTYAHCVSVVDLSSGTPEIVDRLMCGDGMPTNCCFAGTSLYITESRRHTLYRFDLGVEGLPLH
ncbi:MAG: gluconolactonase [Ilumatobacteraceae bacterium]|nr:gluconolactonase [Ilumatobacteraceae bacterium]